MEEKFSNPKDFISWSLGVFTHKFLLELKNAPTKTAKKGMACKVLLVFLGNYSCFAERNAKEKCKNLMNHFSSSVGDIQKNKPLDLAIEQLVSDMSHAMNMVTDRRAVIRMIIFRLICLYAGLSSTDAEGAVKCHDLGKCIHFNWEKYTPIMVTLSCLRKQKKSAKSSISDLALLNRYSFWTKKRSYSIYSSIFYLKIIYQPKGNLNFFLRI